MRVLTLVVSFQVNQKFTDAGKAMWRTMKCSDVWRPSLYMYISLTLGLNIHEGLFYWFTDSKDGPLFAQVLPKQIVSIFKLHPKISNMLKNLPGLF
jgi:hypothetical protein